MVRALVVLVVRRQAALCVLGLALLGAWPASVVGSSSDDVLREIRRTNAQIPPVLRALYRCGDTAEPTGSCLVRFGRALERRAETAHFRLLTSYSPLFEGPRPARCVLRARSLYLQGLNSLIVGGALFATGLDGENRVRTGVRWLNQGGRVLRQCRVNV